MAGQLAFDLSDLSAVQLGTIQVNARTLATNSSLRNRAIQNQILETGAYEFITFAPTAIEGVPGSVAVGETVSFTVVGDLTIRNVTQEVTFVAQVTVVSETQLTGTATAAINRDAFGLRIPSVPQVANVDEEVQLTINFLANGL